MPQMAPISWLILFIIFTITFILFNILNYYSVLPKTPYLKNSDATTENKMSTNSLIWKW